MEKSARIPALAEGLCFVLLVAAVAGIQILVGGTRMAFSMPAYALLGVLGLCAALALRRVKPAASQLCLAATAICFAYILGRAVLSPVPYITRSDVYSVLGGLVVYFFVACVLTSAPRRMLFLALLLALALGHVAIGAVQFRDGTNFMPISWLQRYDYERRASGFYGCPNHLAGLLEVLGVMGLSVVCWSRWPVGTKLFIAYAAAVCYAGVLLSGSRGGYLSAGFSLVVFVVLSLAVLRRTRGTRFWKIGAAAFLVATAIGFLAFYSFQRSDFLSKRAQQIFETTNIRVDLWEGAIRQWKLEPIFGTGTGTYLYFGRLFRTERLQRDPIYVHNDYLHLLAEYGLAGAAGMTLFLVAHVLAAGRNFIRLGPRRVAGSTRVLSNALALNIGAIAAVSSYLVHSFFDFNLHIPANVLLLAFVFGILANDGVDAGSPTEPGRRWWRIALPALGLVLCVQCLRILPGEYLSERARMAVRDQQPALGVLHARRGLKYDSENPDLYQRLAAARVQMAERMGDPRAADAFYQEAIHALERAWALAPRDVVYALQLARTLDTAGRFEQAEGVFYEVLRLDPNSQSKRLYYEHHLEKWRRSGAIPVVPSQDAPP